MKFSKEKIEQSFSDLATTAKNTAMDITSKTKDIAVDSKQKIVTAIDENGDNKIDIEDIIIISLKTPGVGINRNEFLTKEFKNKMSDEEIQKAINTNPMQSGISLDEINKIADEVIKYERNCVTGISTALGMPGGAAMVATLPADITQYYGYMLRAAQKLMYLYGFPQIDISENKQQFDSETLNILIICLGVMYGVAGASNVIKAMAKGLSKGIGKKIMSTALTKGVWYPVVKKIAKWFGVNMTKKMLVGIVDKSLPVIGGVIGGGITYASFKPCCDKLKNSLQDTMLSNPNYVETDEEKEFYVSEEEGKLII